MRRPPAAVDNPSPPESDAEVLAAVDLGSNSFHMIVGEMRYGQLTIIDRIKETVRLAEGLSPAGDLLPDARERAIDCLSRFGERLRDIHAERVRAAGTSTIRRAREDTGFIGEAETALGHPIDVISGIEEARLIYKGVSESRPLHDGLRLVMDIGGGSTELILGQGDKPRALESLHMGCVSMTERFFPDGRISRDRFDRARVAARLELRPVKAFFRGTEGVEAIGTSGTIRATAQVAFDQKISDSHLLTPDLLEAMIEKVLEFDSIADLNLKGLSERRSQVWPGGLAILAELLSVLRVSSLKISDGALREGLLYDMIGRLSQEDARERSVRALASRYNVDKQQARRVAGLAEDLREQCANAWGVESPMAKRMLEWSARLHEIGLDISHDGFQRHGAYIAENADLPGFPRAEQRYLAFMIGSQRHDLNSKAGHQLPRAWRDGALRLSILLRLAVLLNRSRSAAEVPHIALRVDEHSLDLHFDPAWLKANPLTVADLEREQGYLKSVDYALTFS